MSGVPIPDLQGSRDGRGGVGEGVQIIHAADFGAMRTDLCSFIRYGIGGNISPGQRCRDALVAGGGVRGMRLFQA